MDAVIRTEALVKRYGRVRALDGLDLRVDPGEVHGFLGPNGAGKSTTLRILLGLVRASAGGVQILGGDPWRDAVALHRRIASVPGDVSLWPNLSGGEAIDLLVRLRVSDRAATGDAYRRERARLVEAFDFEPRTQGRAYSKGNRQKVALIAAFAVPAELYLLDEPTSGLDPLMERVFQAELRRVQEEGATVLLSSHILSEVEQVCDRVSIVRSGRVIESGSLAQLRRVTGTRISFDAPAAGVPAALQAALQAEHGARIEHGRVQLIVASAEVADLLPVLARLRVTGLRIEPPSLEDLFLRHYGTAVGGRG